MRNKNKEQMICIDCKIPKEKVKNFYDTKNKLYSTTSKIPICKDCLKKQINYEDIETVHKVFRQLDIVFHIKYWKSAVNSKADTLGRYMSMANSISQLVGLTWEDSIFTEDTTEETQKNTNDDLHISNSSKEFEVTDEIIERWNDGYTKEEYRQFEKKYNRLIRNYGEKTALHTEGLLSYIRFRVKEEMATAKGLVKEAKEWAGLASKAATDAKINVSQLSKSDISGGVDVLSQLFEAVETEIGIIPLLPKVTAQPYDDADMVIWAIINYYRRLEDKPKVAYKDIYDFYDDMLREHFDSKGFNQEQIEDYLAKRNNVFRDLEEVYKEPLYETGDE